MHNVKSHLLIIIIRVIILGEAAMLTAQLSAKEQKPMGMNYPNNDNQQMALNIMHWLSKKL